MADTLESLEIEVKHKASGAGSEIAKVTAQIESMSKALSGALPKLRQYAETLSKVGGSISKSISKSGGSSNSISDDLKAKLADAVNSANQIDILEAKLISLRTALQEAINAGDADKAYSIREKLLKVGVALDKAKDAANGATEATKKTSLSFKDVAKSANKTGGPFKKLIASLKRIAFYRIIRSIIKDIGQAFKEGMEAAYIFSSGISGAGHRFAEAMDSIKSSGNAMKGQLGSAFIALYAAIEPVLVAIIDLVTRAADAISQLLSAFTGTTYLKANKTAAKWADTMEKGGAAAKEWKNQLLGFDEINRLEEPSGGGGGSGSNPLEGFDFKDTQIAEKWLNIAQKVKDVIQWIKDHMELIKGLAIAIGAALLAWKVANIVGSLLGISSSLGLVAAGAALVLGGFVALGIGLSNWIKTGELTADSFWLIEGGIVAVGIGLSLLTGSWIPLAVAAVVGAVFAIITQWDKLKKKFSDYQQRLSEALGNGKLEWEDFAYVISRAMMYPIDTIINLVNWVQTLCNWIWTAIEGFANLHWNSGTNDFLPGTFGFFAAGGFPSDGELFLARENGPEMVGSIGGRTAVANNDQIVDGIRQGVFEAVSAAMSNRNGNGTTFKIYLDSKEIKYGLQRIDRAWGA